MRTAAVAGVFLLLLSIGIADAAGASDKPCIPGTSQKSSFTYELFGKIGVPEIKAGLKGEAQKLVGSNDKCSDQKIQINAGKTTEVILCTTRKCDKDGARYGCTQGQKNPELLFGDPSRGYISVNKCHKNADIMSAISRTVDEENPNSLIELANTRPSLQPAGSGSGARQTQDLLDGLTSIGVSEGQAKALVASSPAEVADLMQKIASRDQPGAKEVAASLDLNKDVLDNIGGYTGGGSAPGAVTVAAQVQPGSVQPSETFGMGNDSGTGPPLSYVTTGSNAGQICFNDSRGCFSGISFENVRQCPGNPDCFNATAGVGSIFNDCQTASGIGFCDHPDRGYMASFPHLPLGTVAQVCNPDTRECVIVAGVDYGPNPRLGNRIADLSAEGARAIGNSGLGNVTVTPIAFFSGSSNTNNALFATEVAKGMSQGLSYDDAVAAAQSSLGTRVSALAATPFSVNGSVNVPSNVARVFNTPASVSPFGGMVGDGASTYAGISGSPFGSFSSIPTNSGAGGPAGSPPPPQPPPQPFQQPPIQNPPQQAPPQPVLQGTFFSQPLKGVATIIAQPREVARGNPLTIAWSSVGTRADAQCQIIMQEPGGAALIGRGNEGSRIIVFAASSTPGARILTLRCLSQFTNELIQQATTVSIR